MSRVVLVTGVSTGPGAATALALAGAGHTAYVGIGPTPGLSAASLAELELEKQALPRGGGLRPVALDVTDQRSVSTAVREIIEESGRIDVVVHGMGPVPRGPIECFTPYQLAQIYDAHVLSTQRVNRAEVGTREDIARTAEAVAVAVDSPKGSRPSRIIAAGAQRESMTPHATDGPSHGPAWQVTEVRDGRGTRA